jgi:hypothetical protein
MTDIRWLTETASKDLEEVAVWWDELLADRFPGTRRRWHQRRDTAEKAAERAARDREDRDGRFGANSHLPRHLKPVVVTPPGMSPSPARDDVLDAVAEVTWTITDLRDALAAHMNADRRRIGVAQACRWISSALPQLNDVQFIERVAREARRLADIVRVGTGRSEDVIQLDAGCPICGGETLLAYASRMSVTCVSEECVCDLHDCGCQRGFKHTWTEKELVWLARVLNADEETA